MSHSRSRKRRQKWHKREQKILNSPIKGLSMEDKSPTMPYMLLRNFRVHQTRSTSQGQISECEYFAPNPVECPRCEARDVVFYDHDERRANFLLKGGEKRQLIIKAKRYKCPHCGRIFRETIEGLKPWHRSSSKPGRSHAQHTGGTSDICFSARRR